MPIEGPLRELGIHDVFQLLDLSRKTGLLRVTSELRDNEGLVVFDNGRVVNAEIRNNPHRIGQLLVQAGKVTEADLARARAAQVERGDRRRLGEILVALGAISAKELERQVRLQIEAVIFELMSWREGFFSFHEGPVADHLGDVAIRISTESLLMEGARRIDEWSRIADKVPHLGVIPVLRPVEDDHGGLLDLLPHEWEVLSMIDGALDLRGIAASLGRSEFDVARIAYGLVTTGAIELRRPDRPSQVAATPAADAAALVARAQQALAEGRPEDALADAREALAADPALGAAQLAAGRAYLRLGRVADAADALRRAADAEPLDAEVAFERGYAALARGDFDDAIAAWGRFLQLAPTHPRGDRVRAGLEAAARLRGMLEAHVGG
jgi:hypothetical protein